MNSEELRTALRASTAGLETSPTFAGEVARGGARRLRRRRITIVAVAAATALAVGGTTVLSWQSLSEQTQVATDPRLSEPTRGDLATSSEFVDEAIRVWEKGLPREVTAGRDVADRVIGQPHVHWAGTVPGDRVAVVMQAFKSFTDPARQELLRGVVATRRDTRALGIVAVYPPNNEGAYEYAYRIGLDGRTVLAFELDQPQYLSDKVGYDEDGRARRSWQKMESHDGVVLGRLPEGTGSDEPTITVGDPAKGGAFEVVPVLGDTIANPKTTREEHVGLPWRAAGERTHLMWAGTEPAGWQDANLMPERFHKVLRSSGFLDPYTANDDRQSPWYLSIGLPDGKIATIGEYQAIYERTARVYAAVKNPAEATGGITAGGQVNLHGPLNVLVKLPDSYGWAAAAKGATLSYRTTVDGAWQGERADALLVPPGSVQVQVRHPGQQPAIVDIS